MSHTDYDLLHVMQTLGRNLRDAGALCAAYWGGCQAEEDISWGSRFWSPGCGRPLELR